MKNLFGIGRENKEHDIKFPFKDMERDRCLIKEKLEGTSSKINNLDDYHNKVTKELTTMTMESGCPVADNQNSLTAGERGPILLQDSYLLEKLQHFTRERIPERVVHARGTAAYGHFELTEDMSKYCKAKVFTKVGEKVPIFSRFSLVIATKGEPETARDIRGFAVKFYTEEGNWDLLCNNIPVFPIRDPIKMSDMVHAMKKHAQTNLYDPDAYWDFFSHTPESIHALTLMYSDKGMTDGYRKMHGFANHTFRLVNDKNEVFYAKFHLISEQGLKGLTYEEAIRLAGEDPDYYTRDLYDNIAKGNNPSWTLCLQVMPEKEALVYRYDVFDVTKVWPHTDFPLIKFGKMTLDKLPNNFFMESEQVAFNPSSFIPGIEPTPDKLLQARLFVYRDAQLYRLGTPNYLSLSVNCPFRANVANHERDGLFTVTTGGTGFPNYEPSSFGGAKEDKRYNISQYDLFGKVGRYNFTHPNDDFLQTAVFYNKVLDEQGRHNLAKNIAVFLGRAKKDIQIRQCEILYRVDKDYGMKVAGLIGLTDLMNTWLQNKSA
jgi:catalase